MRLVQKLGSVTSTPASSYASDIDQGEDRCRATDWILGTAAGWSDLWRRFDTRSIFDSCDPRPNSSMLFMGPRGRVPADAGRCVRFTWASGSSAGDASASATAGPRPSQHAVDHHRGPRPRRSPAGPGTGGEQGAQPTARRRVPRGTSPCRIPELRHVPRPAVSSCWFVWLIRSRRCSSLQFKPVNTFSAPTGVAAAKSACAMSFTGAPAQMVQFVDRSGLDANVAC
jgi:hypothetical protein